jgi:tight adherence protein C
MTLVLFLFSASVFLGIWYYGSYFAESRAVERRIRMLEEGISPVAVVKTQLTKVDFKKQQQRSEISKVLASPGTILLTLAWLSIGFLVLTAFKWSPLQIFLTIVLIPLLVARFIRVFTKRGRLERIQRELPGALDLMVVCLEAGLAINSALLRIANEMEGSPLGRELRRASGEINAGIPLEDALRNLAKRTEVPDLNTIVSAIVQAQKMGSSLALTFRVQSETLREKYKMNIKERIQKIPVKILFPLVLFIFPALFVVILGPPMMTVGQTLKSMK